MQGVQLRELRDGLDRLTAALTRPTVGALRWVPRADRTRLVESLRELAAEFARTDLKTRRAFVGGPRAAVHARSDELAAVLRSLTTTLRRHHANTYAADELSRLRLLLEFPAPDFLGALGRSDDENSHSDVIAFLLDPRTSPGVAPVALLRLASLLPDSPHWESLIRQALDHEELSVRREVQIGRFWEEDTTALDRIDIVVSGRDFVLAIENKVWSREHDNQTQTYWEWLAEMPGRKAGILLSPGGVRATSSEFQSLSYERVAWCFLGEMPSRSPEEEVMLSAYLKAVFGHVLRNRAEMLLGE